MRKEINGMIIEDGILIDGSKCKGDIIIPDEVTRIGGLAFTDNVNITSIIMPNSVTSINDYAFYECTGLTSINISDDIDYIGLDTFKNCINLTETNILMKCPEQGSFIAYKKCIDYELNECIVKLEIPEDALRSSAISNKCRCNKAKVLSITTLDNKKRNNIVYSMWDRDFLYTTEQTVEVKDFDTCRWNECAPGIHFFMTRDEAVNYKLKML